MEELQNILHLINQNLFDSALSQLTPFTQSSIVIFLKSKCLFLKGYSHSALPLLQSILPSSIDQIPIFTAQIYISLFKYEEAIKILRTDHLPSTATKEREEEKRFFDFLFPFVYNSLSIKLFLLSYCYHKIGNVEKCVQLAQSSLQKDPANEELLNFVNEFCIFPIDLKNQSKCKDSCYNQALLLTNEKKFKESLKITNDNYQIQLQLFLPLHLCNLICLKDKLSLYRLGQLLFQHYPKSSFAYLTVGCYYLLQSFVNNNNSCDSLERARKYFCKSTLLNRTCQWSWEGFALTFSLSFDYDQSIAAFSTLSKLLPSNPIPYLRIAIEYARSDNLVIATKYLEQALSCLKQLTSNISMLYSNNQLLDIINNELGVIHFKNQNYPLAMTYFDQIGITNHPTDGIETWLVNKAICSIYLTGKADQALQLLKRAVQLNPTGQVCYLYSVALFLTGQTNLAIDELFCSSNCQERAANSFSSHSSTHQPKASEVDETREFFDFLINKNN